MSQGQFIFYTTIIEMVFLAVSEGASCLKLSWEVCPRHNSQNSKGVLPSLCMKITCL